MTAPYVQAKTIGQAGAPVVLGFHYGGLLPTDVAAADIKHLLRQGLVERVE